MTGHYRFLKLGLRVKGVTLKRVEWVWMPARPGLVQRMALKWLLWLKIMNNLRVEILSLLLLKSLLEGIINKTKTLQACYQLAQAVLQNSFELNANVGMLTPSKLMNRCTAETDWNAVSFEGTWSWSKAEDKLKSWPDNGRRSTAVTTNHPEGDMKVCTKFNSNPPNIGATDRHKHSW